MASNREEQGLAKLKQIAGENADRPLGDWSKIAPDMRGYIVNFVAGDILSRPGLTPKLRQFATVAMLAAMNQAPDEFRMHLGGALRLGWSKPELVELMLQTAVFAGFPAALNALKYAAEVFEAEPPIERNRNAIEDLVAGAQQADADLNADAFVALLTPDATFRVGSQPVVQGRTAIHASVSQLFAAMNSIRHETIRIWSDTEPAVVEAVVHFETKAGAQHALPYINLLRLAATQDRIADYRIHIDLGPIFAAPVPRS